MCRYIMKPCQITVKMTCTALFLNHALQIMKYDYVMGSCLAIVALELFLLTGKKEKRNKKEKLSYSDFNFATKNFQLGKDLKTLNQNHLK